MGGLLGHDFSQVRVHNGEAAADSARRLGARAYTVGNHIFFGRPEPDLGTGAGRFLLAHELAHVVQQRLGGVAPGGGFDEPAEREAAAAAAAMADGRTPARIVQGSSVGVQRQASESPASSASTVPTVEGDAGDDGTREDAPAVTTQVDVRATRITGLGPLPVHHLFVIYRNSRGVEYFFRGGPGGSGADGYGPIVTNRGRYLPGTVDWEPGAPSVTAMSGPAAVGKDTSFIAELDRIHGARIPYKPTGPNSNSVARTILHRSGVPEVKPVFIAPGWGRLL